MWAAYKGRTPVAQMLLEKGAHPNITGQVPPKCISKGSEITSRAITTVHILQTQWSSIYYQLAGP